MNEFDWSIALEGSKSWGESVSFIPKQLVQNRRFWEYYKTRAEISSKSAKWGYVCECTWGLEGACGTRQRMGNS